MPGFYGTTDDHAGGKSFLNGRASAFQSVLKNTYRTQRLKQKMQQRGQRGAANFEDQAKMLKYQAELNQWQQTQNHGISDPEALAAAGGNLGAMQKAVTARSSDGEPLGNPAVKAGDLSVGGFSYPKRVVEEAAKPTSLEHERPTHVVNPADNPDETNPMAGRQFSAIDSSAQGAFDLRKGPQTKKVGQARAMEWGPLSKEDKATDALRTTKAQAARDEVSLAETPVEPAKPAKKAKAPKVSSE